MIPCALKIVLSSSTNVTRNTSVAWTFFPRMNISSDPWNLGWTFLRYRATILIAAMNLTHRCPVSYPRRFARPIVHRGNSRWSVNFLQIKTRGMATIKIYSRNKTAGKSSFSEVFSTLGWSTGLAQRFRWKFYAVRRSSRCRLHCLVVSSGTQLAHQVRERHAALIQV